MRDWRARAVSERARASGSERVVAVVVFVRERGKRFAAREGGGVQRAEDWQRVELVPSEAQMPKKPMRIEIGAVVLGMRETTKMSGMPGEVEAQPAMERASKRMMGMMRTRGIRERVLDAVGGGVLVGGLGSWARGEGGGRGAYAGRLASTGLIGTTFWTIIGAAIKMEGRRFARLGREGKLKIGCRQMKVSAEPRI